MLQRESQEGSIGDCPLGLLLMVFGQGTAGNKAGQSVVTQQKAASACRVVVRLSVGVVGSLLDYGKESLESNRTVVMCNVQLSGPHIVLIGWDEFELLG